MVGTSSADAAAGPPYILVGAGAPLVTGGQPRRTPKVSCPLESALASRALTSVEQIRWDACSGESSQ